MRDAAAAAKPQRVRQSGYKPSVSPPPGRHPPSPLLRRWCARSPTQVAGLAAARTAERTPALRAIGRASCATERLGRPSRGSSEREQHVTPGFGMVLVDKIRRKSPARMAEISVGASN